MSPRNIQKYSWRNMPLWGDFCETMEDLVCVDTIYRVDNYTTRGVYYTVLSEDCGYLRFFPLSGVSRAHLGNRISLRNHNQLILRKEGINIFIYVIRYFFLNLLRERNRGRLGQYRSLLFNSLLICIFDIFFLFQYTFGVNRAYAQY
ncbi:MAG: hypothetical protein US24_C0016G0006 [candidate division WS6 bacterium GW2011_GWC2_36_7]|uniref:Uncharacterized protein n=2 Tax=Candidatus Dojkabacteria TaxID=74243 RepID=A0A0G0FS78_9BACT|nr:MAG: hypothetical protein US24_C0016G0006 [candidate division WS6 bacterium GW2011_GWC2_36_7]KKQ16680.1 MAG: hypothetical protein US29_C0020G0002 [candidate division WS6 bacterium GW2011_GWF1_36_8]